jgi:hypothetical protein
MQAGSMGQQQPLLHALPSASAGQQQHLLPVALGQQHHLVHACQDGTASNNRIYRKLEAWGGISI